MSDLKVSIVVGGAMDPSVGSAVGSTVRRLDKLRKATQDLADVRERRSLRRGQLFDSLALGAAVLGPIGLATKAAIDFESVMADVRKVVDFDTPEQFAAMSQDVLKLSERIPVAASGIGDIVAAAGQAGIAREELTRFAEDAAKVAVAFDISGAEAGGRLTGMRSIFKLNQDEVMALAGAYNHLSNNMDATAPAMLNIAERTGAVASQFGLTGEQTGALAATMLELKTPPEVAGTAINALLVKLSTAPQQSQGFQDALDDLGLSADELKENIEEDAQGALLNFLETVDQAEDKQAILFGLFGQEYVDDITKLAGGVDNYREALRLASDQAAAATSIDEEYAARAATTENQLELLKNKTNALGVNIGSVLLPSVNDAVGGIGNMVSKGAALAKEYPGVTRVVIGLVGGLVGLRVISALGGYAATFLQEGWILGRIAMHRAALGAGALGRSIRGLSFRSIPAAIGSLKLLRLALIGTGIGAAVVALGVGAALIMRYWEPIKAFFGGVAAGIGAALQPLEPVFGWLGDIVQWVGSAFLALSEPVDATSKQLEGFRSTGETVGRIIGTLFRGALLPITATIKGIGTALKWLGVLDDAEVEAGVRTTEEAGHGITKPGGGVFNAKAVAAATAIPAAAFAAAPTLKPTIPALPAFPAAAVEAPVTSTAPAGQAPAPAVVDAAAIAAQVQAELGSAGEGDAEGDAAFERIEAGLADLEQGDVTGLGATASESAHLAAAPREVSLVFHQTFHFDGVGPDVADEVTRQMERVMRRASVEAGLAESDDAF